MSNFLFVIFNCFLTNFCNEMWALIWCAFFCEHICLLHKFCFDMCVCVCVREREREYCIRGGLINLVLTGCCQLTTSVTSWNSERKKIKALLQLLLQLLWFVYLFCLTFKLSSFQLSQVNWVNLVELEIFLTVVYKHYIFH